MEGSRSFARWFARMKRWIVIAGILGAAPATVAADKVADKVTIGAIDVWDGPFESLQDVTARDLSPPVELSLFDGDDDFELPATLPIDDLVARRRHVVACTDSACEERENLEYRLAVHTSAGWFTSGQLGVSQNRDFCYVTSVTGSASRVRIQYRCSVGRFDWASKEFLLLCAVDRTGRPACGRTLLTARHNVHTGGKSDSATDVIYDTLSCAAKINGDTVTRVARKVQRHRGDETPHVRKLAACRGTTRFPLSGPFTPGTHEPPPLFEDYGAFR